MAAICVFCASGEGVGEQYLALAADFGSALAAAGHSLVSGGAQVSMMGALARAARAGGARTVGVIPASMMNQEIPDRAADELVVVDSMAQRKQVMAQRSDAFVALPGGLGTLDELFEMWTMSSLGLLAHPVIVLDSDGFYAPLWVFLDDLAGRGFVRPAALDGLHRAATIESALAALP